MTEPRPWWQSATIYQIYPRSFQDSNGDGVGDLKGIRRRLPYLVDLGVDAVWLSPIFQSPMADFGYDISDYTAIDPLFGTMDDFDALLAEAHRLGLKLILDFVPNHTSDKHPWFIESRSSRDNPKRDWYLWRDGKDGGPPNNWLSEFGGSAWQYDETTGQYYYHAFLDKQPDLNWRNPNVVAAMHDVMRFWLRKGVDGFRVDVIWHLIKDARFRDNPPNPDWTPARPPNEQLLPMHTADQPEVHDVVHGMRRVIDEFPDRLLIGEIYLPVERLVAYYGRDLSGAHLPFNFALLNMPWRAEPIAELIREYEMALPDGGWPNWVLGNHDRPRIVGRIGVEQARIAAMLLLTLRGTPTLYYGDELGMPHADIPPDRVQDPFEKNVPGIGVGRDGARTPMRWDPSRYAGFSTVEPWLPIGEDAGARNVEAEHANPQSILTLYQKLLRIRRETRTLQFGSYRRVVSEGSVLKFSRELDADKLVVTLNLSAEPATTELPDRRSGYILVSTCLDRNMEKLAGEVQLNPNEGLVIRLDPLASDN
jgi:alpha-glucosidase